MKHQALILVACVAVLAGMAVSPVLAQTGPSYGGAAGMTRGAGGATGFTASTQQPAGNFNTTTSYTNPPQAAPVAGGVALVNVTYLFENCAMFKQQMESLRSEMQQADDSFKKRAADLQARMQELQTMKPDDPSYKTKASKLAEERATFEVDRANQRKQFLVREGKVYYSTFLQIQREIQNVAMEKRLMAVIRFNQEKVDPENPEDVLRDINRQVLWYNGAVDITGIILGRLENAPRPVANHYGTPGTQY